jgi:hypothetical protein
MQFAAMLKRIPAPKGQLRQRKHDMSAGGLMRRNADSNITEKQ